MKTLLLVLILVFCSLSSFSQKAPEEPFEDPRIFSYLLNLFGSELSGVDSMKVAGLSAKDSTFIHSDKRSDFFSNSSFLFKTYYAKDFLAAMKDSSIYLNALFNEEGKYLERFSCTDETDYKYLLSFSKKNGTEIKLLLAPESGKFSFYVKSDRETFELFHSCINSYGWIKLNSILKSVYSDTHSTRD